MVGDVAGFAAATYLRGVPVVQVPTTLLAQVDSAIGGKVGVNHAAGQEPHRRVSPAGRASSIDPELLATLPRREFRAGLYEVVKYGVIASRPLFDRVGRRISRSSSPASRRARPGDRRVAAASRAVIVEEDERESGPRRALNFGHTLGHALEAVTKYRRFRHGEAVGYGMLAAAEPVGRARRRCPPPTATHSRRSITQMGPLPPVADLSAQQVVEAVGRDKKVIAGRLHFVLPIGHRRDDDGDRRHE